MGQLLDDKQKDDILNALNVAADSAVWQKSNFLKVIGRQLQQVRETFKTMMTSNQAITASDSCTVSSVENKKNTQVYISIYSAKGGDIKTWEHILANLPKQMVARPIYTREENIIAFIRSKPNTENEAYVSVAIPTDCIVDTATEKVVVDKLNQPLTTTRGRALNPQYEGVFVHSSGRYQYFNGRLTKLA